MERLGGQAWVGRAAAWAHAVSAQEVLHVLPRELPAALALHRRQQKLSSCCTRLGNPALCQNSSVGQSGASNTAW